MILFIGNSTVFIERNLREGHEGLGSFEAMPLLSLRERQKSAITQAIAFKYKKILTKNIIRPFTSGVLTSLFAYWGHALIFILLN